MQPVILVLEADATLAELTRDRLLLCGMEASIHCEPRKALRVALSKEPDIVMCDVGMSSSDGIDFAEAVLQAVAGCRVIMTSASPLSTRGGKILSEYSGRAVFLQKPFSMSVLVSALEDLLLR